MRAAGVRELRERMTQILREVSERGESIDVTHHGRVMARLVPPPRPSSPEEIERRIERLRAISEEIGRYATRETDSSTLMPEHRR
jgi:antitoxin (DNA-binding transcriptional repressor) of toxin-antitoxin stability system